MSGLREQKKQKARERLAQAALTLFSEKGFERTTVDEIAAHAGISRRSFFRYFSSKEEAAFPQQVERLESFRKLLQTHDVNRNGVAAVREACLTIGRQYSAERSARLARHRLVFSSPTLRAYEQKADVAMEQILVEELTHNDQSPERVMQAKLFAAAVLALVRVTINEWAESDGRANLEEIGRRAFRNLESGFQLQCAHTMAQPDPHLLPPQTNGHTQHATS